MTKGLLVFQSDFGNSDGAVSAMHGVANSVQRGIPIFEITHLIPQYNIWEASYRLFSRLVIGRVELYLYPLSTQALVRIVVQLLRKR